MSSAIRNDTPSASKENVCKEYAGFRFETDGAQTEITCVRSSNISAAQVCIDYVLNEKFANQQLSNHVLRIMSFSNDDNNKP